MSAEPRRSRRRGTPISDGLGADLHALGGILANHTRGLDAYLNCQAQRLDDRQHTLLAESTALSSASDLQLDQLSKADLQALYRHHKLHGWSRLRHADLLAFVRQHLQPSPVPEPVIHASDASRTERLLLLLLVHLGGAPEAVQVAWRGKDNKAEPSTLVAGASAAGPFSGWRQSPSPGAPDQRSLQGALSPAAPAQTAPA